MDQDKLENAERLVKYLRGPHQEHECEGCMRWGCDGCAKRDRLDAADMIEAQQNELVALRAENAELRTSLAKAEERRDALEGQLYEPVKRLGC